MKIGRCCMTGLGLGYAPVASGTFGSAGAIAIAWGIWAALHFTGHQTGHALDLVLAGLTFLSTWGCIRWGPWAVQYFTKVARKPGDPGQVVLDEFAGQWVSLLGMPLMAARPVFGAALTTPQWVLLVFAVQFFFFRLFDVIKPPPGRQLEKLPSGWGIVFDDLAAGVYANLVGQILFRLVL
jgi:phosphatidylglycerophosphatase A